MHRDFADWYELLQIKKTPEMLPLRWEAVEALSGAATPQQIPDLVRIFYSGSASASAKEIVRQAAKEADTSFVMEGSDRELAVLAGAVLADLFSRSPNETANVASLALETTEVQGLRQRPRLQSVIDEGKRYAAAVAIAARSLAAEPANDLDSGALVKLLSEKGGIPQTPQSPWDVNKVWQAFEVVMQLLTNSHEAHVESINKAFNLVARREREQSDILWWLFSEHTIDGKLSFSELSVPASCFRAARDLADLTRFLPPPFAAPAFLKRVIRTVKKRPPASVKLADAISESDSEWRGHLAGSLRIDGYADLCPMLFALVKSVEVGGTDAWGPAFEYSTALSASCELPPARMALQIYNELLLARSLGTDNG